MGTKSSWSVFTLMKSLYGKDSQGVLLSVSLTCSYTHQKVWSVMTHRTVAGWVAVVSSMFYSWPLDELGTSFRFFCLSGRWGPWPFGIPLVFPQCPVSHWVSTTQDMGKGCVFHNGINLHWASAGETSSLLGTSFCSIKVGRFNFTPCGKWKREKTPSFLFAAGRVGAPARDGEMSGGGTPEGWQQ